MSSGVRFAPSALHVMRRTAAIVLAIAIVGLGCRAFQGAPSLAREVEQKRPPYGPTLPFGLVQFTRQVAMFGVLAVVARRVLRVKL